MRETCVIVLHAASEADFRAQITLACCNRARQAGLISRSSTTSSNQAQISLTCPNRAQMSIQTDQIGPQNCPDKNIQVAKTVILDSDFQLI